MVEVNVTYDDDGIAPEQLIIKIDPAIAPLDTPDSINLYVSAYSPRTKTCTVSYDDHQITSSFSNISDFVFSTKAVHQYQTVGFYDVILCCSNDIGTSSVDQVALAVNTRILYANQDRAKNISIPITGSNVSASNVMVVVNNVQQTVGVFHSTGVVTLANAGFVQDGENVVVFQTTGGVKLSTEVYNVQAVIENVQLVVSTSARPGQPVNLTLSIAKGDGLNINISYGDASSEIIYILNSSSDSSMHIVRNHSYSSLGVYTLSITVANDVSFQIVQQSISIESIIQTAKMSGSNVTVLNDPTIFSFNIDTGNTPSMSINVDFDYDDGNRVTVLLQQQTNSSVGKYFSSYTYHKYGLYRIRAIIKNEISSIVLPTVLVQVGENITLVDIYINESLITLGQDVVLTVVCPTGSPVALSVDMGDGHPFVVSRPPDYTALDDKTFVRPDTTISSSSDGQRKKRDTTSFQYSLAGPQNFVITYRYKTSGTFYVSMNVTNIFSSAVTNLCPNVIVVPSTSPVPQCAMVAAVLSNMTTLSSPLVRQRSALTSIPASAMLQQCSPSTKVTYVPGYTWTVDRLVGVNTWRPELRVCASDMSRSSLSIPPNTLWYGMYRVNLTVIVNAASSSSSSNIVRRSTSTAQQTVIKSAAMTTYLSVAPSPLIATIANSDQVNFVMSQILNIDLSQSGDPDVIISNKSGMNMYLFCYTGSQSSQFAGLTLAQMLNQSTFVAQNIDKNVAVYMFKNAPCFSETRNIWVSGYEVFNYVKCILKLLVKFCRGLFLHRLKNYYLLIIIIINTFI